MFRRSATDPGQLLKCARAQIVRGGRDAAELEDLNTCADSRSTTVTVLDLRTFPASHEVDTHQHLAHHNDTIALTFEPERTISPLAASRTDHARRPPTTLQPMSKLCLRNRHPDAGHLCRGGTE
jgi:hypothetical protein